MQGEKDTRKQLVRELSEFLHDRMGFPEVTRDVIVRINEVGELGQRFGMAEAEAWKIFRRLKGTAWEGQYIPGTRSQERGYTAARLTQVPPRF